MPRLKQIPGASGSEPLVLDQHQDGPPTIQRGAVETSLGVVLRDSLVTRTEWRDPDDAQAHLRRADRPGGRDGAKMIRGYKRTWTIDRLHVTCPSDVTEKHVKAATRWLNDFEKSQGYASGGKIRERVDGESEPAVDALHMRFQAADRFRDAILALGETATQVLLMAVIDNRPLEYIAGIMGINSQKTSGRVCAALDRLLEHYRPPTRRELDRGKELPSAVVGGLPAERFGRWREIPLDMANGNAP
jgi:DNA-directed RNA polymerase specialized sigma24 family protein